MQNKALKPIGIGLIAVLVIGGLCLFSVFGGLRNLLGGNNDNLPNTGGSGDILGGDTDLGGADLGAMYSAIQVDANGCPLQETDQFYTSENILVGLEESYIPSGTEIFVRLSYEGSPIEDTAPIVADRDLQSCVWFEFDSPGGGLADGDYQADLYVNGRRADSLRFAVSDQNGQGSAPADDSLAQLGALVMTAGVDEAGCPLNQVDTFYSDETVYLAAGESYIPAGTEVFARLSEADGSVIEDTQPIVADQDMQTCFWFSFEGSGFGGLPAGDYEAEIYVDGQYVDSVSFAVR